MRRARETVAIFAFGVSVDKPSGGWRGTRGTRHERGYGASWDKLRLRILQRDCYLCQACLTTDRITPSTEVDHTIPKIEGGTDDQSNLRSLCSPCHLEKSRREKPKGKGKLRREDGWGDTARKHWGYSIPNGLMPSSIPVVLVCGPPASGKSTYIGQNKKPGDMVIDFDNYLQRIGAVKWTKDQPKVRLAFSLRDADLRSLQYRESGAAWVIAMAPTAQERASWLEALGTKASCVVLDVDEATCMARVDADNGRKHAKGEMIRVIGEWWASHS